jgi:hypothetical protein
VSTVCRIPSTTDCRRPPDAVVVADRYRHLERPLSGAVALPVAVRAPLFTSRGTAHLVADATLSPVA